MKNRIAGIIAALVIALPAVAADPSGPAPQFVLPGKGGNQPGSCNAASDAVSDPYRAAGNALCGRQHDADDQAGLDDLAKNDEKTRQHMPIPRSRRLARFRSDIRP